MDGSITFKDVNGEEVYSLPKPFMSDSNMNAESGESATSENVSYDIKKSTTNTYTLKIIADKE